MHRDPMQEDSICAHLVMTHFFQELSRGATPFWVLAVLRDGAKHGYAIARALEQRSNSTLHLREGTLYPLLHSLEAQGLVTSEWVQAGKRQRRQYALTDAGLEELRQKIQIWREFSDATNRVTKPHTD